MGVVIPGAGGATREDAVSGANILGGSLRFNSGSSHYLNRTFGTPTNNIKWTWSGWVKRSAIGAYQVLFIGDDGSSNNFCYLRFSDVDELECYQVAGGSYNLRLETDSVFRDLSAWYHIVLIYDSANATPTDRAQIYVNGNRQTVSYVVGPFSQNTASQLNANGRAHAIGRLLYSNIHYLNGYLTEINFIDDQALTPSSFGFTDSLTNTWKPKKYTGTYGTNGFYLPLDNNDAKGTDRSGNNNNWTANNFIGNFSNPDVVPDSPSGIVHGTVPTSGITTTTGITKPNNYCTLSPLGNGSSSAATSGLSNGNLQVSGSITGGFSGSIGIPAGKWYWEVTLDTVATPFVGVCNDSRNVAADPGVTLSNEYGFYFNPLINYIDGTTNPWSTGSGANGDIIGVAVDTSNLSSIKLWLSKNNTWYSSGGGTSGDPAGGTNQIQTITDGKTLYPYCAIRNAGSPSTMNANFGQRPFKYDPPTGFLTLCTANFPRPSIVRPDQHFYTHLYTGNGSTQTLTGFPFQPEFTWIKERGTNVGGTGGHRLYDCVRGYSNGYLSSNTTTSETASGTINNTPNGSDPPYGLTLGTDNDLNESNTYVAWNWKAGGPIGVGRSFSIDGIGYATASAAGLASGTITPTGASVNTKSGFSIVSYTGNSTGGATVAHGLGKTPSLIIVKNRDVNTTEWLTLHTSIAKTGDTTYGNAEYYMLRLNSSDGGQNYSVDLIFPGDSSNFALGGSGSQWSNHSGNRYIAYCWAEIPGFSKFGTFTGNASTDGVFVYCGFKPALVICKRSDTTAGESWSIWDNKRAGYNPAQYYLAANSSAAEDTTAPGNNSNGGPDFLSNGFKMRSYNGSSNNSCSYIFAAWAETPAANLFGGQSNAR